MLGHWVTIIRINGEPITGILNHKDDTGVTVHCTKKNRNIFIPYNKIDEIEDNGEARR